MMRDGQDAYGRAFLDRLEGRPGTPIVERDDGFIDADFGLDMYFGEPESLLDQAAFEWVRGRVLDVGCGAGRHSLALQARGHEVVGIDESPGAVEVCRRRGVRDARQLRISRISTALGRIDTAIFMGNNLGLLGNLEAGRRILRRLHRVLAPDGRIVGQILDPYDTEDPDHRAYHAHNRERGRPGGQIRIRVRYRAIATPWLDLLWLSREELADLAAPTGWRVVHTTDTSPMYVAVLEKS